MYSVGDYGFMLADLGRTQAYTAALRKAVRPGSVVAEIGTGLGYFAMLACQLGARRVYAMEVADVIEVARQLIGQNGYAETIQLIPSRSTAVELPERADVIISDLHGVLPLNEDAVSSIIHARECLLSPGGRLIPRREIIWAGIVESQACYDRVVPPSANLHTDFDLGLVRRMAANTWKRVQLKESEILAPPQVWATLDYETVTDAGCSGRLDFQVSRQGTAHGIALWFDSELYEDVGFSNCPGGPEHIFGQGFFPFEEPITAGPGTRITVQLRAAYAASEYVWCWDTTAADNTGRITKSFKQGTIFGNAIAPHTLRKCADGFIPTLSDDGVMAQFVLGLMDGNQSLREIAARVCERFPRRFGTFQQSLDWVCERSRKYSR